MLVEVILAGFGGQGVLSTGMILAYAAMAEGLNVAWLPSYGPEMRGGTASCGVTMADGPISSPVVVEPDVLIAMNQPSLERFAPAVKAAGLIIYNASLISQPLRREDVQMVAVPANEIAEKLGNTKVAGNVMLGAYLAISRTITVENAIAALPKVLPPDRHNLIPLNEEALAAGVQLVQRRGAG